MQFSFLALLSSSTAIPPKVQYQRSQRSMQSAGMDDTCSTWNFFFLRTKVSNKTTKKKCTLYFAFSYCVTRFTLPFVSDGSTYYSRLAEYVLQKFNYDHTCIVVCFFSQEQDACLCYCFTPSIVLATTLFGVLFDLHYIYI